MGIVFWTGAFLLTIIIFGSFFGAVSKRLQQKERLPDNHPKAFLEKGMREQGKKVVACIGADAIHGNMSYNFVEDVANRQGCKDYQFINDGINGSLAQDVLERLDSVIQCDPEFAILLIGLNEATIKTDYDGVKKFSQLSKLHWYEENLVEIVSRLKTETSAQIALMSLPLAGENLFSKANKQIDQYNDVIRKVAESQNVNYIPFNEKLKAYLKSKGHTRGRSIQDVSEMVKKANFEHFVRGKSLDRISSENGFLLLTDGMHLNSTAGMMAAHQIELFLKKNELKAIQ